MKKIPFSRVVCDGRELELVREVLESGWLTTAGKALEFEKRFAAAVGARFACAVNSCTAALHLALEALGVGPGDKVLVPTWTFTASAEVVRYLGADPVLLDVDEETCLLTPEIVEAGIRQHPDAKVLIVVHFAGHPAEMERLGGGGIVEVCKRYGVRILEDAAHAFPTRLAGRLIGSFGDITCFSFYANKTITTGEGGMLTTENEVLYRRCKIMRLHGIDRDVWARFTSDKPSWEYDVVAPGYKYNMPDINAAIGLAQLERAEQLRRERQRCAEFYLQELADIACLRLPRGRVPVGDHSWHLFPVVLSADAPVSRNRAIELLAERGIGTSVHYKPIHRMTYYRDRYGLRTDDFPTAERIWRGCFSLPIHAWLTTEELRYIADSVCEVLTEAMDPMVVSHPKPAALAAAAAPARIYLSPPHLSGGEQKEVQAALASNWVAPAGPQVEAFETEFAARVGRKYAVALTSGTAALHLAMRLLGIGTGDEVLVSTFTFIPSANPVVYQHGTPVFIDSEQVSWNMDPILLEKALAKGAAVGRLPKAVVVVDLYGQAANYAAIEAICRRYGVPLIEDAAEALGATCDGRPAGAFGLAAAFSFNGNKIITTSGGGMLVSDDGEFISEARRLAAQAREPVAHYEHKTLGYNYRMSNVLAGIGRAQLQVLDQRVNARRRIFARYAEALKDLPGVGFRAEVPWGRATRWLTCVTIDPAVATADRDVVRQALENANIESRPVWKPLHRQPIFQAMGCQSYGGKVSEILFEQGLCLPSGSALTEEQQDRVIGIVRACFGHS